MSGQFRISSEVSQHSSRPYLNCLTVLLWIMQVSSDCATFYCATSRHVPHQNQPKSYCNFTTHRALVWSCDGTAQVMWPEWHSIIREVTRGWLIPHHLTLLLVTWVVYEMCSIHWKHHWWKASRRQLETTYTPCVCKSGCIYSTLGLRSMNQIRISQVIPGARRWWSVHVVTIRALIYTL